MSKIYGNTTVTPIRISGGNGNVDLSDYYTKEEVDSTIEHINIELDEREYTANRVTVIDEMSIMQDPTYPTAKAVFDFVNDKIDNIETGGSSSVDIVDNLTSTDTNKALSANQGRILKEEIDNKIGDIESALDLILALQSQY